MIRCLRLVPLLALGACGGGEGNPFGGELAQRDSAGVIILEYPAGAIAAAPAWTLSAAPLAVIGDDSPDATLDLSTASMGGILSDGRVVVATAQPAQLLVFNADGTPGGSLGRQGEGPGEYRFLQAVLVLPGDTVLAFEIVRRKAIRYAPDGTYVGETDFPLLDDRPIAPILRGRLADGTFVLSGESMLPQAPGGEQKVFRLDLPIFTLDPAAARYDTLTVTKSAQMYASSISMGGQTMPIARPVAFGPTPLVTPTATGVWLSSGESAELREILVPDTAAVGTLHRIVRFQMESREVTEADRTRYKTETKEMLASFGAMMPPGMLEAEQQKVDETLFANVFPAFGQLRTDLANRLWLGTAAPFGDSQRAWAVLSAEGQLLGRVDLPDGMLFSAGADRVVMRREDAATGLVRLEIWGVTPAPRS